MNQYPPPPAQISGSLAIEQLNDLVYVFDRQLRFLYVNDTACRILGYAREELLAVSAAAIGAAEPASQEAGKAPGWNIGEQYTAESSLVSRGGRVISVEISARVIDHAGEPVRVVVARDIGERKLLEEKANARIGRFRTLAENSPDCVIHLDVQLRCTYANPAFKQLLGDVPDAHLIGQSIETFSVGPVLNRTDVIGHLSRVIQDRTLQEYEVQLRTATGEHVYLARSVPEFDCDHQLVGVISTARDITPLKRMESELAARARQFHTLVDHLPDVVVRYDLQLRRTYVNAAFHAVHGTTDEDVLGKFPGEGSRLTEPGAIALQELLRQTFATRVPCDHEFSLPAKDGNVFYWHLRVNPEFDENKAVTSLLTVWYEVTDRKHLLASLDRMAYHDALTGIANRALLVERITQGVHGARQRDDALALLFVDLDRFKLVNDRWGHEAGDALLVAIAQRLQNAVRETDTVARYGGDEFAIVLAGSFSSTALTALMDKIGAAIAEPVIWKGTILRVGASIGLARYPEDGDDATSLLQHADGSMYSEKARRQSRAGRHG